jgi:protein phosphatase 1 regulatory subunit 7
LRILDGQDVTHLDKVKADILFGADIENKKEIFKSFLQDEQFVDRRLFVSEQIDPESDSEDEGETLNTEGKVVRTNKITSSKNVTLSSIYGKRTK